MAICLDASTGALNYPAMFVLARLWMTTGETTQSALPNYLALTDPFFGCFNHRLFLPAAFFRARLTGLAVSPIGIPDFNSDSNSSNASSMIPCASGP